MKPLLSDYELQSTVWLKLKEHIEAEITQLRLKNDSNIGEIETALLRGRLGALKNLLALAEPTPAIVVDEPI